MKHREKAKIAEANDKFTSGEGLEDYEVELLLNYYYDLIRRMTGILGEEFSLMHYELNRRGEYLDRIKKYRKRDPQQQKWEIE